MANRKFEMYEYRQVLMRMRLGETDGALAKTGLMGRCKLGEVRRVAETAALDRCRRYRRIQRAPADLQAASSPRAQS